MASKTQRELAFLLTGDDRSASKAMKGVGGEMKKLSGIAGKAGSNAARNIERGVLLGTTAAAGAIGYAIKRSMDFESSSASVAKTVGAGWEKVVAANREMALSIPVDVNELNEISAQAGAMGVAGDDITSFTKTLALLTQTADDVDAEAGATFLGHLRTNMKLTGDEIVHTGDLVTHLGNNSAATEGEILSMAESVSGAAGFINASIDDVVAWSAAMASAGEESEAGGSAIQRVWIDSAKFVSEAGDELETLAKISGVSMATFEKNFAQDGAGTLATFVEKLGELDTATQLAVLESLGWDDIRITRAMGKLLANTDNLTNAYAQTEDAAGAAGKEAEVRFGTAASQVQILKNNIDDAAITIGDELLPVMVDLAQDAVGFLKSHQAEIHEFAQELGEGVREAVEWAQKLDWEGIGSALQTGATAAQAIITAFASAPSWVQQVLVGGFVANKFTGGAVMDLLGLGLRGGLSGLGQAGGGTGGALGALGRLAAQPVFVTNWPMGGLGAGAGGLGGAGGSSLSRILGTVGIAAVSIGLLAAAIQLAFDIKGGNDEVTDGIEANSDAQIKNGAATADLIKSQKALATGLAELKSKRFQAGMSPILGPALGLTFDFLAGDAMKDLEAQLAEVTAELERRGAGGAIPTSTPGTGGPSIEDRDEQAAAAMVAAFASAFGTHTDASAAFGSEQLTAFRTTAEGAIDYFDERIRYLAGAQGSGAGGEQYLALVARDIAALNALLPTATAEQAAAIKGEIVVLEGILAAKKFDPSQALLDAVKPPEPAMTGKEIDDLYVPIQDGASRTVAAVDRAEDATERNRLTLSGDMRRVDGSTRAVYGGTREIVAAIQALSFPAPQVNVTVGAGQVTKAQTEERRAGNSGRLHAQ